MKKFKKIISKYLPILFISLVIGFSAWSFMAKNIANNAVPMPFGVGMSVVLSGSMEPELSVGDLLFLKEENAYKEGEIVVYQSGRTAVVHRIISIDDDMVTTKGDANNVADDPFALRDVKAKVTGKIPVIGYAVIVLKNPVAVIALIGLAVLLLVKAYAKEKKEAADEQEALRLQIRELRKQMEDEGKGAGSEGEIPEISDHENPD